MWLQPSGNHDLGLLVTQSLTNLVTYDLYLHLQVDIDASADEEGAGGEEDEVGDPEQGLEQAPANHGGLFELFLSFVLTARERCLILNGQLVSEC